MPKTAYRALAGIDYPPNKRAEIGDVVDDLPGKSITWLLEQGHIQDAALPWPPVETPTDEAPIDAPVDAPVDGEV